VEMKEESPLSLDIEEKDRILAILPRLPILSSYKTASDGVFVEYHRQPVHETPEICYEQNIVVIHLSPANTVDVFEDGKWHREHCQAGDVSIAPAQLKSKSRWSREFEFLIVRLDPDFLLKSALESIDGRAIEIMRRLKTTDILIHGIGLALKHELQNLENSSRFYFDSLTTMMAVHLLRNHAVWRHNIKDYRGGLPKYKQQQVIDYIHNYLGQDLSLIALAELVKISPYHFARLFKQSVGTSPGQYVIKCRINKAKWLLAKGNLSILEITQQVGFQSQSHFSDLFRRTIGVTPSTYRKSL
jgi:AraC family transcriptional regulator